ncbi:pyridoxamine 5'-phosphate oxidase family protein [Psychromarinibacter sp. C21-152]|uniref:Pyridoxamine 5'-phosphate oxidase family protein n=1 Tax=Psychromarinibacter sediminicola TaxID=3033385 RepID=A0AAE3P001_9RHOB|nr:pyridoxamine 5'-phosphate oxidase family protein [Psychromarinibacter sediminicola]MDF0603827.1 pyridoxamine 5'-phosphate oxidase family protein [Psychromarinibacter sediminicola]
MAETDPIRPTDDEARALARALLDGATSGALGVLADGAPMVTRIAVARDEAGGPLTLVSALSQHTTALRAQPACSLMVGEPGDKGDPLTHPRLTLQCRADFVPRPGADHDRLRALYLRQQPKAKLYIDFGDFALVRLRMTAGFLNGGFGRASRLAPEDLGLA